MDAAIGKTDPRVAPAVEQLSNVTQRVHAVWKRMGIASRDRQQKWDAFLFDSLLPFLDDFCALQEAAEYNAATENDALLRDVCHLATRLDETPRRPEVASIVSLLKEYYAQTQQRYPFPGGGDCGRGSTGDSKAFSSDTVAESAVTSPPKKRNNLHGEGAELPVPPSGEKELTYPSLPSFTTLLGDSCPPKKQGENNDEQEHECIHESSGVRLETRDGNSNRGSNMSGNDDRGAATEALRRLLKDNTHEGVRQQLRAELDRLQRLADNRLQVLQLLCKQRAIMNRSAQDQVLLRAAYRAKYLGKWEEKEVDRRGRDTEDRKRASHGSNSPVHQRPPTTTPVDAPSSRSSRFHSPVTSSKTSSLAVVSAAPFSVKCEESSWSPDAKEEGDANAAPVNRPTTSLQDATRAELQLLLSASSCSLDLPRVASSGGDNVNHALLGQGCEEELGLSVGPTYSFTGVATDTSTTAQTTMTSASVVAGAKRAGAPADTEESRSPSTPSDETARATLMEVDVSSITAYGTHQDLTLTRIQTEADAIMHSINEHNRRMQLETQEELHALDTLEVLWRAISMQKTSPKTSLLSVLPPRSKDAAGHEGKGSGPTPYNRDEESTTSRLATTSICSPLLPPLKPEPYERTVEEIVARYRQLHAAYDADVAAQQQHEQQPRLPASAALPHVTPASPFSAGSMGSFSKSGPGITLPATKDCSDSAGEERCAPQTGDGLYLPPAVRQVLHATSYAPVLDYVHQTRVAFQAHLSAQQDLLVEKTMARLRHVYEIYYAATRDKTYAVAPDGELRVAMEEELLETLPGKQATAAVPQTPSSADNVLLSFQRHLTACQQVREQAADEVELLTLRLHIIGQAAPLVHDYQEIVREEAEMHATSRERLLSKRVNMAKQLLQEERTRRRVAKELPRIVKHLKELIAAWDALQAATDPREDTADVGNEDDKAPGAPLSPLRASAKAELWVHGQRVRDLLTVSRTTTPPPVSRVRNRSVSSPPPLGSNPPIRSVSPTTPALARHCTEQRFVVPGQRSSPHPSHKASPTPAHTSLLHGDTPPLAATYSASQPLPGRHCGAGAHKPGGVSTSSGERHDISRRPHWSSTSPAVRSCTPPYSQPTPRSYKPSSARPSPARVPSRSPPPLLPQPPRHGLSAVSTNASSHIQKRIPNPSTSPSPSSTSATLARLGRPRFT
ncbi:hypothetical protein JKF63_06133 [Porcisia hertigi]|uniref:Uncharacterized protein n=1 Tax=Porcisia hertigi TaxID=2761500 RepID=A0A836IGL6_9TRYP|nr:hypothetical protein JKF63_06133 [Porcisia hertigi]